MVLALFGVMAGAEGWDDIEDWGRGQEKWLRQHLRLRNGIPGRDTIRRVFEAISPRKLGACFTAWVAQSCPAAAERIIAIDGKSLRGAAGPARGLSVLHQVSAYAAEYGLTLGQVACEEKSNEITAIGQLLPNLALEGAVVTIDAIGCQCAIAESIVDAKGEYVLAVKDNQPRLAEAVRDFFNILNTPGYPKRQTSVACVESTRQIGDAIKTDRRYVLSSAIQCVNSDSSNSTMARLAQPPVSIRST